MENISSNSLLSAAQESPINVISKFFTSNEAIGFALKVDAKRLSKGLSDRDSLADIANRRSAPDCKIILRSCIEAIDECAKFFHSDILPSGNKKINTVWCCAEK